MTIPYGADKLGITEPLLRNYLSSSVYDNRHVAVPTLYATSHPSTKPLASIQTNNIKSL